MINNLELLKKGLDKLLGLGSATLGSNTLPSSVFGILIEHSNLFKDTLETNLPLEKESIDNRISKWQELETIMSNILNIQNSIFSGISENNAGAEI